MVGGCGVGGGLFLYFNLAGNIYYIEALQI